GSEKERTGMSSSADFDPEPAILHGGELGVGRCTEQLFGGLLRLGEEGVVQYLEETPAAADGDGGSADGVPDEGGDRGRFVPLAPHVANDEPPRCASDVEDVVEVAADLGSAASRV